MSALDAGLASEVANYMAAKQAVRVAKNLLRDDPGNRVLETRLLQATQTAEEAQLSLRATLREHGLTPEQLQEHLRQQTSS